MSMDAHDMPIFDSGTLVYCPRCHGEGEVDGRVNHEWGYDDVMLVCPLCEGRKHITADHAWSEGYPPETLSRAR